MQAIPIKNICLSLYWRNRITTQNNNSTANKYIFEGFSKMYFLLVLYLNLDPCAHKYGARVEYGYRYGLVIIIMGSNNTKQKNIIWK